MHGVDFSVLITKRPSFISMNELGSGRRGRRPGTAFANASARLSNDSGTSEGLGTSESTTAIRAMSTRPRKTLPDSALFFPSPYDDAQQLLVSGAHTKKRLELPPTVEPLFLAVRITHLS